jgi:hypothetical protein
LNKQTRDGLAVSPDESRRGRPAAATLADLEHEIAHTDSLNFKDMLKRRREVIKKLLAKLPDLGAPAT